MPEHFTFQILYFNNLLRPPIRDRTIRLFANVYTNSRLRTVRPDNRVAFVAARARARSCRIIFFRYFENVFLLIFYLNSLRTF